jgi:ABC-type phosphate transport system permease subunit
MGEVVQGGLHYSTLFSIGLILLKIKFLINLSADIVLEKQRKRWRR